jgi:hypothetical protein
MVHQVFDEQVQVSASMVRSVFGQLKANGYSDGQIVALSRELAALATRTLSGEGALPWSPSFEVDLSQLGYPA